MRWSGHGICSPLKPHEVENLFLGFCCDFLHVPWKHGDGSLERFVAD